MNSSKIRIGSENPHSFVQTISRINNSLKSANLPDGRRDKAAIRLESHQARGQPFLKTFCDFALAWAEEGLDAVRKVATQSPETKDNVMAQAIREVARNAANEPQKCPGKRGSREQKSSPTRLNSA